MTMVIRYIMLTTDIANRIENEVARFWTRKNEIRSLINEVNKRNVFYFIKNMLTISDSRSIFGDIRKYITYNELKHVLYFMLEVAEELGISPTTLRKYLG